MVSSKGDEAQRQMQEARGLFAQAREEIRKYGPLGETMSLVLDAARAGNAPDFLPAERLADVAGVPAPPGEDISPQDRVIRDLSGKPYHLPPVEHDGQLGWWKRDILDRCREFLTGKSR